MSINWDFDIEDLRMPLNSKQIVAMKKIREDARLKLDCEESWETVWDFDLRTYVKRMMREH